MTKKAIIWSTFVATLLLIACVIYFLVEQFKLNIIIVSLLVTGAFSSIAGTAKWFFREKIINSLIKLPKDRKERLLSNYIRQLKIYKFMIWQSPLYALIILLIYYYAPYLLQNLQIETIIVIAVIAIFYYLSIILNLVNKKFAINKLKENLL